VGLRSVRSSTVVELSGGLGNQLFQIFAGLSLSQDRDVTYQIVRGSGEIRNSGILEFDLPLDLSNKISDSTKPITFLFRISRYLLRKNWAFRILAHLMAGVYQSPGVGFDRNLTQSRKNSRVVGYFQTYRYAPAFVSERGLRLTKHSDALNDLISEVKSLDPIVFHIRGGDYLKIKEEFGVLSGDFYSRALSEITKISSDEEIWVFTNDLELTKSILTGKNFNVTKILSEQDLSAAETLVLMSFAQRIVISNSTFSWWAAYSQGNSKTVVAPSKWCRSMEEPLNLIPSNWIRVQSTWLN
jgi:hypothetical protein